MACRRSRELAARRPSRNTQASPVVSLCGCVCHGAGRVNRPATVAAAHSSSSGRAERGTRRRWPVMSLASRPRPAFRQNVRYTLLSFFICVYMYKCTYLIYVGRYTWGTV
eukprot:2247115-Prymnesium_polylepis.1